MLMYRFGQDFVGSAASAEGPVIRYSPSWPVLLKHPSECRHKPPIDPTIERTNVVLKSIPPQDELTLSRRPFEETCVFITRFARPAKTLLY